MIITHMIKIKINLAVGSKAKCEGIGTVQTQLTPNTPPVLLAPVFNCPASKITTVSPSTLKYYNK